MLTCRLLLECLRLLVLPGGYCCGLVGSVAVLLVGLAFWFVVVIVYCGLCCLLMGLVRLCWFGGDSCGSGLLVLVVRFCDCV